MNDFKATYKQMTIEQLMELSAEMEDLVPEAKFALVAELTKRGKTRSDIEEYSAARKRGLSAPNESDSPMESEGGQTARRLAADIDSRMLEGPIPAGWVQIPRFGLEESLAIIEYLGEKGIQIKILSVAVSTLTGAVSMRPEYDLVTPESSLEDCITALKDFFDLCDDEPLLFSGECAACGAKVENVMTCPECDLSLATDSWEHLKNHPFVKFLEEKGYGKQKNDG